MSHPFGDLLRQYRARKAGLSQTRLANMAGYDQAVLVRMSQGKKDLTGPSGRERVVHLITVLRDEGALLTQHDANTLLKAAGMPPLFEGQPAEQALLRSLKVDVTSQTQPVPMPAARMDNLPAQITHFIGRKHELTEVIRLMSDARLLTLTGSGGCGKTRLALEAGASLIAGKHRPHRLDIPGLADHASPLPPVFADGVWLVQLAPLSDPALVADAVASTLGLRAANRPAQEMVTDYLLDKCLLLILDNCEHLIQACAELTNALLHACPDLHILATSREPLNILGEVTWRVPSLAPDEAIQLFIERARAARPDFALLEQNRATVAQVCRRLDNIPLAIELAAARLRAFSVEQLATQLNDTFGLLTAGNRTALPRQQTLRATIDWSYDLLTEEERALLRHLSVFAGGWTLEEAEAVCGFSAFSRRAGGRVVGAPGMPVLLDQLVNKSLVLVDERVGLAADARETRYSLLETIRQYTHEKLTMAGEHEQAHASQLAFFVELVQSAQPHIHGPRELEWLDRFDAEIDNLRAALEWCAQTGDVQAGMYLVDGLWYWWHARGYLQEGQRWIELELPDDRTTSLPAARATARIASGWLAARMGYLALSNSQFVEAVRLAQQAENARLIVQAGRGFNFYIITNINQAMQILPDIIHRAHESSLLWDAALAQRDLATDMYYFGQREEAYRELRESLDTLRVMGNIYHGTWDPEWSGRFAVDRGDYTEARAHYEQMVTHTRTLRDPVELADCLILLAEVALRQEDQAGVLSAIREAITIYYKVGNLDRPGQCASYAAGVAFIQGEARHAAMLLGAAEALWRPYLGNPIHPYMENEYHRLLPLVRTRLAPADFDAAWAEGQQMTLRQVMADIMAM